MNFPLLHLAHAALKIEADSSPSIATSCGLSTSEKSLTQILPRLSAKTTKPVNKFPCSCKASLIEEKDESVYTSNLRVDYAQLFTKLANILPLPHIEEVGFSKDLHDSVMNAVESCTTSKKPLALPYFVRRGYSSPIKGKNNGLLIQVHLTCLSN
jgi:hypothetical protein